MQFACFFVKREVEDVGPVAMETSLPFDQKAILEQSTAYLKSQLNFKDIDIVKTDDAEACADAPDRLKVGVHTGKASLRFH